MTQQTGRHALRSLPRLRLLLLALLLVTAGHAYAQPGGRVCFNLIDAATGARATDLCVGRTYHLRHCGVVVPFGLVIFDRGLGTGFGTATDTVVVYPAPGRRRVRQLINAGQPGDTLSRFFQVYPTAAPRVQVVPCLRGVAVTLDSAYSRYTVSFNGAAPTTTTALPGSTVASGLLPGSAAGTVRVTVTGTTRLTNPVREVCPSAPFDTTLTIPALPLPAQIARLDVLAPTAAHRIRLDLKRLLPGRAYVLERNLTPVPALGTWGRLDTLRPAFDTLTVLLGNAPTARRHRYRLRLVAATGCDAALPATALLSNEAGAMPLAGVTISAASAVIRWPDYPAAGQVMRWVIRRDGVVLQQLTGVFRTYTDLAVGGCERPLCYEVLALVKPLAPTGLATDTLRAFSSDSCIRTLNSTPPPAPTRLAASFDLQNNLLLRARLPPRTVADIFGFSEVRGAQPPVVVGTSRTPAFAVLAPDTGRVRGLCYVATLTDTCGTASASSAPACPTFLRVRRSSDQRQALLTWTAYVGFPSVFYTVEVLDDRTNALVREADLGQNILAYADPLAGNQAQILRYRIRAEVRGDTAQRVYSNFVDLTEEQTVRLPNAFTPNGDDLNDTFGPLGRYELREMELTVYDRWGRQVYQTTSPNQPWDGRAAGGDLVPAGVFLYRFRGRDALNREFSQKGTVTVLR